MTVVGMYLNAFEYYGVLKSSKGYLVLCWGQARYILE